MIRVWLRWAAVAATASVVVACGGGLIAGVGSGGSGFAAGTVTGFGSVVVDGKAWDVSNARIEEEVDPSVAPVSAQAKLGQQVEIEFAASGTAGTVRIEANVVGHVSDVNAAARPPEFTVAGQLVRINSDASHGPVTFFAGYGSSADVQTGDVVEVHGATVYDNALGRYTIQATRIDKLAALPAGLVRVTGVVESLAGQTFRLGGLSVDLTAASVIVSATRALADGQRVVVWGREPLAAGPTLTADFVRIKDPLPTATPGEVSGVVSRFDVARSTFGINGIVVDARNATMAPMGQGVGNGVYAVVTGTFRADGTLGASRVDMGRGAPGSVQVALKGPITDFVNVGDFVVRGVPVDASAATLTGCANSPLADGVLVEVRGNIADSVVRAVSVQCD